MSKLTLSDDFPLQLALTKDEIDHLIHSYDSTICLTTIDLDTDQIDDKFYSHFELISDSDSRYHIRAQDIELVNVFSFVTFLYPDDDSIADVARHYDGKLIWNNQHPLFEVGRHCIDDAQRIGKIEFVTMNLL